MFWGEFRQPLAALDRCTLNKGAFTFKIVRGAQKWPLKGGSRLIEVAATAGLTVYRFRDFWSYFILLAQRINLQQCLKSNEIYL